ncbi:MAG: DUF4974 domain-containing protein [Prolixibacteraceae bacterium]|nr:DUF4974 domain-containing protein [Prolixibacteraceae bacterium]
MTKRRINSIDYIYIWRKLKNSISPEEDELLSEWLKNSPEHMKFFLNARDFQNRKLIDNTPSAWINLNHKLKQRRKKRILVYCCAASFALVVGFSFFFFHNSVDRQIEAKLVPVPGIDKATLILNDGTSHTLDKSTDLLLEEDGAKIKGKEGLLVYSPLKKKNPRIAYNTIYVPRGGEFFLILSDSTKIWINSETMIRYPSSFSKNERRIELIGEAYFEVKKDESRPFVVVSDQQLIKVTGTAFNVSSFGHEGSIVTTLVEGSIQLSPRDAVENFVSLLPGNQSIFDNESQSMIIKNVNVSLYTSWKDGYYDFQGETIENMLCTLSRWYNFNYQFNADKVRLKRFSGRLKRTDSFQRILSVIEKTDEIKFTIEGTQVIVN